uniref:Uncharacterized protein n=1 Tax=Myripristis murdjan TaxID=586833 RepID=A0A667WG69_9TELE
FFLQELKEKKEVEVEDKENGSGEAPANGTVRNAEEAPPAEEVDAQPVKRAAEEEEVGSLLSANCIEHFSFDLHKPILKLLFSFLFQENVETKKQKTEENGDSKEAEVEA